MASLRVALALLACSCFSICAFAQDTTATTLAISPEPASPGSYVTLTASVTRTTTSGIPTGSVTFSAYGRELGSAPVNGSGRASFIGNSSGLAAGNYVVTAAYGGDSDDAPSSASATVELRNATSTTLGVTPNTVISGATVTLAATVAPASGGGAPTGTVAIEGNGQNLATVQLTNGGASIPVSSASYPPGTYNVFLKYSGDSTYAPSTSNIVSVTIEASNAPLLVAAPAVDVAWDSAHSRMYISVPSSAGVNGNSIGLVNTSTGSITSYVYAGSDPDQLSVSANGTYLYVGVDGSSSVERFNLSTGTLDLTIPLGSNQFYGPNIAGSLAAAPADDHTWAVSTFNVDVDPEAEGGITIYDDGTARPTTEPGFGGTGNLFDSIVWGADDTAMYAENSEDTGFDYYVLAVNNQGITLVKDVDNAFSGFGALLHYDKTTTLVYSDSGQVLNAQSGAAVGTFGIYGPMVPDGANGKAFFAASSGGEGNSYVIQSYDINHYTPLAQLQLENIVGTPFKMIRYGKSGLAILTYNYGGANSLYLVNDPTFVTGSVHQQVSGSGTTLRRPGKSPMELRDERATTHLTK